MPQSPVGHDELVTKLRTYATRERNSARAMADGEMTSSARVIAAGAEIPAASYYRARQNAMDDILRLLRELAPVETEVGEEAKA